MAGFDGYSLDSSSSITEQMANILKNTDNDKEKEWMTRTKGY